MNKEYKQHYRNNMCSYFHVYHWPLRGGKAKGIRKEVNVKAKEQVGCDELNTSMENIGGNTNE